MNFFERHKDNFGPVQPGLHLRMSELLWNRYLDTLERWLTGPKTDSDRAVMNTARNTYQAFCTRVYGSPFA